ncbi:MAG TPA: hypothetical protein VFG66_10425 [Gemmatimonadales bacterium]|nr:hypothetical protein [Gemmatimonadales bacterium]
MSRALLVLMLSAALVAGCGRDRSEDASASLVDSTLFGDDRGQPGDTARVATEVAVLEGLVDRYERLDVVMDELAGPSGGSPVRGKAWKGDRRQDATKSRLLDLLLAEFGERYHPRTPEGAARLADSIASLPRGAGARALDALVLDHHRKVVDAIAGALPVVRNPRVRKTLTELQDRLREEIERLARASPANAADVA